MEQFRKEFIEKNMEVLEFLKEYKKYCEKEFLVEVGGLDFKKIFPKPSELYDFYQSQYIAFEKALEKSFSDHSIKNNIQKIQEEELIIKDYYKLMKG